MMTGDSRCYRGSSRRVGLEAAAVAMEEGGGDSEARATAVRENDAGEIYEGLRLELAEMLDGSCIVQ